MSLPSDGGLFIEDRAEGGKSEVSRSRAVRTTNHVVHATQVTSVSRVHLRPES
jgi:hypothetical protein